MGWLKKLAESPWSTDENERLNARIDELRNGNGAVGPSEDLSTGTDGGFELDLMSGPLGSNLDEAGDDEDTSPIELVDVTDSEASENAEPSENSPALDAEPTDDPAATVEELQVELAKTNLVLNALVDMCVSRGVLSRDDVLALAEGNQPSAASPAWSAGAGSAGTALVETEDAEGTADGFDFGAAPVDADSAISFGDDSGDTASVPSPNLRRKPQRGSSGMVRQFVGIVGGGAIGIALALLILPWLFSFLGRDPKQADFLKIGHKLPAFLVPAEFHSDDGGDELSQADTSGFKHLPKQTKSTSADDIASEWDSKLKEAEQKSKSGGEDELTTLGEESGVGALDPTLGDAKPNLDDVKPAIDAPDSKPEPKVKPEPKPQEIERVPGAQRYTSDELGEALKAANDSKDGLVTGSLSDPEQKVLKLDGFKAFCNLAERYTLVRGTAGEDQLDSRRKAAESLAASLGSETDAHADLGRIADSWIQTSGRTSSGVLLVGQVKQSQPAGDLFAVTVVPHGRQLEVTVLTDREPTCAADELLVVLGTIVEDPSANVVGYQGDAKTAVWSGLIHKVE